MLSMRNGKMGRACVPNPILSQFEPSTSNLDGYVSEKQTPILRSLCCSSPYLSPNHLTLSPRTLLQQSPNRSATSSPSCSSPSARDISSTMSTLTQITSCINHVCWVPVKTLTFGGHRSHNLNPKLLPTHLYSCHISS